jgi:predicted HTH domain antitoxin
MENRLKKSIESYKLGIVNISAASEIAGLSYREFLDVLEERNIPLNLDTVPLEYGVSSIKKSLKKK